jgi:CheY-like chemotaxis protein
MDRYLLVVDDDAGVREMLCEVIAEAGYRVVAVEDGQEALLHLQVNPPPFLILLDLMMPVMDGRQFRREQRRQPDLAAIPVAVLSADIQTERGDELRDTRCLSKPIDLDQLLDVIRSYDERPAPPRPRALSDPSLS